MVEVRLLVPITTEDDQPHAVDEVLDVNVETAEAWRAAGKVALVSAEEPPAGGHYTDVTGRDDIAPLGGSGSPQPGPQEPTKDDDDNPPRRKKK